ncbi:HAD family hydrolase [Roseomonas sp. BN140053]|uniref:HAD family hydrolase n=1 Tax=Roseomonas sp. BN140053 TaxID=3391898 RepID=UPI0039EA6345
MTTGGGATPAAGAPALPRAIVFDWDNTLVDGWGAISAGLNAAFDAFGLPRWTLDEVKGRVRKSLRDSFPAIFGAEWERAREVFYREVRTRHLDVLHSMPGTTGLIPALATLAPLAVVSNKQGILLRAEADRLGWTRHFRALVGASDTRADKPAPEPLRLACAACGVLPGPEVWYVGDTGLDMQAARRVGCKAVLLGDAEHDGGVGAVDADLVFPDAEHLRAAVTGLASAARMR